MRHWEHFNSKPMPAIEALELRRLLASTLISVAGSRDLVFDDLRDALYVTTASGSVQRFDIATKQLLTPWQVGGTLYGADITADKSSLYITDGTANANQARLVKVSLGSGFISSVPFAL